MTAAALVAVAIAGPRPPVAARARRGPGRNRRGARQRSPDHGENATGPRKQTRLVLNFAFSRPRKENLNFCSGGEGDEYRTEVIEYWDTYEDLILEYSSDEYQYFGKYSGSASYHTGTLA